MKALLTVVAFTATVGVVAARAADASTASVPPSVERGHGKVDLNTADIPTLESLPEIGTNYANAVVAARPFKSVEDVQRVLKLPPEKLETLRGKVTVSPPRTTAPTAADVHRTDVSQPPQANEGKAIDRKDVSQRYEEKAGGAATKSNTRKADR